MPIRQSQMISLMEESRRAHRYGRGLRDQILTYFGMACARYPNNKELLEVLTALEYNVKLENPPDDRETWENERHYRREAKRNDAMRKRQEVARRMAGIPSKEEALAILHAKNELRRADLPTSPDIYRAYEEFNKTGTIAQPQENVQPKLSRPNIILPKDHPDDRPLEFDSAPAGDEISGPQPTFGLDIPPDPYDNGQD